MKHQTIILLIAIAISAPACDDNSHTANSIANTAENTDRKINTELPTQSYTQTITAPAYPAELRCTAYRPDGSSGYWAEYPMSNGQTTETSHHHSGNSTISTSTTRTTSSSTTGTIGDGRKCQIAHTLLQHKDNTDIWQFEITYTNESQTPPTSNTITTTTPFDGQTITTVTEDQYHIIEIRPIQEQLPN